MYYKIFIDIIFQHSSVLYVLEHLLLFIEEVESPLCLMQGWHGRSAGAFPTNFRKMCFSAGSGALLMFTRHPKAIVPFLATVPWLYFIAVANRCLHRRC